SLHCLFAHRHNIVVKFRRTGESTRSEDECGGREEALQVEGGRTDMESVSLADGAPVPREFANPTDDTFMVEDAVEAIGFGTFQWKLSILTGLSWMADAMEMMILSILAPQLHCEWALPSWEVALLTSVLFASSIDVYVIKTVSIALWTLFYGLLSAFAPVYGWILFLRALVGFGIGGAPQSLILIKAAFDQKYSIYRLNNRLSIMSNAHQQWLPESARYDVLTGNQEKALNTLKRIATENNVPMPLGKLIAARQEDRGKIQDLFSPHFRLTTILLWFIWFSNAFSYYGVVLLTTALFQEGGACGQAKGSKMEPGCSLECKYLNSDDYKDLLWTTLSEFPGLLVTLWAIDRLGRRKTMALCFFVFSLCIVPLYACVGRTSLTVFIFIARAFIAGGFQAAYVYTPEVYPTATRALGLGTSSGMARVGALITPFVAQVMLESSVYLTLSVYCCCCLLAAIASCALPIETTGRGLQESSHREWGQEMMRRASDHSPGGIPHSSSGSQD
uniref:Synaptic vesicle 2-related protein-like n=1 Tax=Sinocyclocheilus rhinocerous TaxID=307959 RepID=A0A673GWE3_9TELE